MDVCVPDPYFLVSVWPPLSIHASMFQKVAQKKKTLLLAKQVELILELLIRNEPDSKTDQLHA